MIVDINDAELYAGLSGGKLEVDSYDFTDGIVLSKTFAHLMAPFIMAFSPAESGKSHPAPWKAAQGGVGYDVHLQLHIPRNLDTTDSINRLNTVWWITALLRLTAIPSLIVPVISNEPFSDATGDVKSPYFWPVEASKKRIILTDGEKTTLNLDDLNWIKLNWREGAKLVRRNKAFGLAFETFDQGAFANSGDLYLLALWSGLEALFSPSSTELRFRISSLIATFLESPGPARRALQKKVAKLYDARSHIVHGSSTGYDKELFATNTIMRKVLKKMIELRRVPSSDELEDQLFASV